ncbi:uncharacterized protein LOC128896073 [Hylaeus anthracinus]|uniref:uncharacterized protein LOC128896073 n=1 Tax=Hylaeus anthracinus TaxID=313031 RepID=UPI0023B8A4C4|nr:uncharacterized protein LOC128896073 [Hylaeus anthracinus]
MWRTFCLLSLMLFAFDFPRDGSAESTRPNADRPARGENQSYQETTRRQTENNGLPRRVIYDDEVNSGESIGKWRNNGEALEPKWRDGDTVPLFPFPQLSRYTSDKADNEEDFDYSHRAVKHRRNNGREESRPGNYDKRVYRGRSEKRKDSRASATQNLANSKETSDRMEQVIWSPADNKEATSVRYREAFQIRPNDYEHELDDEEYLKPRPRKRRPPQNYEFALAENETESNPGSWQSSSESERGNQFTQNAVELRSLLKMQQEEGLSLSELLQRKNLTLDDLLKGKADAINALKSKDVETEDYIEEASRMMYNTLTKATSTTKKPQYTANTETTRTKNAPRDDGLMISFVDTVDVLWRKNLTDSSWPSLNLGNATTGKSISVNLDPGPVQVTPNARAPAAITTSMPTATNSVRFLQDNGATKLRDGDEIKPESLDEDEIMEFSDFTDYKNGRNGMSPVWLMAKDGESDAEPTLKINEDRGSTLSIEQILNPTESTESTRNVFPENERNDATKLIAKEIQRPQIIVEHQESDYTTFSELEYQEDAPLTYHDLEQNTQINTPADEDSTSTMDKIESASDATSYGTTTEDRRTFLNNVDYSLKNHQIANATEKHNREDATSEIEPEARAEIFELFASGSAGKRLERLLKSRNMSLEELIALRQRGSSKVHLAEVSRLKARKPNNEDGAKGRSNSETNELSKGTSYEFRERNGTDISSKSFENATNGAPISNLMNFVRPVESTTKRLQSNFDSGIKNEDMEERRRTVQIVDLLTTFGSLPFAKDLQRDFAGEYKADKKLPERNSDLGVVFVNDTETVHKNDTANVVQSGYVKEILEKIPNSIDIQTVFRETSVFDRDEEDDKNERGRTLSKVKPSIIASGAILGVTIVVFLAIFIVCRIRQKQKYRYRNTFSRAVFQGPILAARKLSNSSSLSTVMVNVVATSTTKRPERNETRQPVGEMECRSDIDNDSLDANDSWETIPDYMK